MMRISSSRAASPVAANMISGHGSVPGFIIPAASRNVMHTGCDDEDPRQRAGPEEVEDIAAATRIDAACHLDGDPVEEAEDQETYCPADLQPVGCLELAQIHICLQVTRLGSRAPYTL